jgi:hypothetical protein
MEIDLDHLFVCTAPGAPEAEKLVQFGLHEAPPNQHPGQGTACRRFSFANAMIELFWVSDASEAQSQSTRRTLLWERWSGRQSNASPFGICVRPVHPQDTGSAFLAWDYRPAYLPDPLSMQIGEAGVEEPMWIHLSFMRRAQREGWFIKHPIGIREITLLVKTYRLFDEPQVEQQPFEALATLHLQALDLAEILGADAALLEQQLLEALVVELHRPTDESTRGPVQRQARTAPCAMHRPR